MNRRHFLQSSAASATFAALPFSIRAADKAGSRKFRTALIGCGWWGNNILREAMASGACEIVGLCDVDARQLELTLPKVREGTGETPKTFKDYREMLAQAKPEIVIVGTPDHWHTRICIDAMKAGKDVFCEKPLTLTIDEGKKLREVVEKTGKVLQVGTQQRSDHNKVFLMAVALLREGRIGKIRKVTAAIGGGPSGGPFARETPPPELNWDLWLGQAPKVDYTPKRCHADFRWWYEYSGGKLTDWGAHHVDVAHWGLGKDQTGPTTIEVVRHELPVAYKDGWPTVDDRYNTATTFLVRATFADGVPLEIRDDTENGVMFEGERGKIFVTRDRIDLQGGAVGALFQKPVAESTLRELRHGKGLDGHFENFFACCGDRGKPASDVWSHHRALTTCHLANIAIRLGGRKLTWDPEKEAIVGDDQANAFLTRPQRAGFEITA